MKYALMRLGLFALAITALLIGQFIYFQYPAAEIALWLFAPITAAIIAWAFTWTIESEVKERVNEIIEEESAESDREQDEQTPQ